MKSSQCDSHIPLTTSHYYFMAFERGVCNAPRALMSALALMLCGTQRPLLRVVRHPSLEFANISMRMKSTEERGPEGSRGNGGGNRSKMPSRARERRALLIGRQKNSKFLPVTSGGPAKRWIL